MANPRLSFALGTYSSFRFVCRLYSLFAGGNLLEIIIYVVLNAEGYAHSPASDSGYESSKAQNGCKSGCSLCELFRRLAAETSGAQLHSQSS